MSARRAAIFGAWTVLVAACLVAVPTAFRDRLPDPMATHWSGRTPDGSMSFTGGVIAAVALWVALAALFILLESVGGRGADAAGVSGTAVPAGPADAGGSADGTGAAGASRGGGYRTRRWCGAVLGGAGALFAALAVATVRANLDRASWHDARLTVWSVVLPLAAGVAFGVAGWWLDMATAPPRPAPRQAGRPVMDLAPGERVAWTGQVSSPVMAVLAGAFAVIGVVCLVLSLTGPWAPPAGVTVGALVLCCVGMMARIRVTADRRGLRVAFGPLGRPVRRVALERITTATAEDLRPMEVGGWGYRGLPGNAAIMLRGGPCLVVRYDNDRNRLVVSVDGADTAAAVLNSLRHHASR